MQFLKSIRERKQVHHYQTGMPCHAMGHVLMQPLLTRNAKFHCSYRPQTTFEPFSKNLEDIDNNHVKQLREKLMAYTFDIQWIKCKENLIAHAFSRAPVFSPTQEDHCCKTISPPKITTELQPFLDAAQSDDGYKSIIHALLNNSDPKKRHPSHPAIFWLHMHCQDASCHYKISDRSTSPMVSSMSFLMPSDQIWAHNFVRYLTASAMIIYLHMSLLLHTILSQMALLKPQFNLSNSCLRKLPKLKKILI